MKLFTVVVVLECLLFGSNAFTTPTSSLSSASLTQLEVQVDHYNSRSSSPQWNARRPGGTSGYDEWGRGDYDRPYASYHHHHHHPSSSTSLIDAAMGRSNVFRSRNDSYGGGPQQSYYRGGGGGAGYYDDNHQGRDRNRWGRHSPGGGYNNQGYYGMNDRQYGYDNYNNNRPSLIDSALGRSNMYGNHNYGYNNNNGNAYSYDRGYNNDYNRHGYRGNDYYSQGRNTFNYSDGRRSLDSSIVKSRIGGGGGGSNYYGGNGYGASM